MKAVKQRFKNNLITWFAKKMEQCQRWINWPTSKVVCKWPSKRRMLKVKWPQLSCNNSEIRPAIDKEKSENWKRTISTRQLSRVSSIARTSRLKTRSSPLEKSTMRLWLPPLLFKSKLISCVTSLLLLASCSTTPNVKTKSKWTASLSSNEKSSTGKNLILRNGVRWKSLNESVL